MAIRGSFTIIRVLIILECGGTPHLLHWRSIGFPFGRRPLVLHSSLFVLHFIFLFSFVRSEKMRYLCRWTSWRIVLQAHDADASKPQSTPSLLQVFQLATKEVRVGNEARHNEGVYLTLCLRRVCNLANSQLL